MIKKLIVGFFAGIWNSLNFVRRLLLNGITLFIVIAIAVGIWDGFKPQVQKNAVLTIAPYGALVEQWQGDPVEAAIGQALGESNPQTRLFDVLRAIDAAASDSNISGIVLRTDNLFYAGPAQLQDIGDALNRFKNSGKPVYAYGRHFSQSQYYLASHANQVLMDPYGEVMLQGFAAWRNYYADAAEKLKATVNVFRVGEYKTAVEPWLRNDMSPAAREANNAWLNALWASWREVLSDNRQIKPVRLESYVQDFNSLLAASEGDAALTAMAIGLVDKLATPDDFRKEMIAVFGEAEDAGEDDGDTPDFPQVGLYGYLAELEMRDFQQQAVEPKAAIAVVAIQGALMEGASGNGYANIAQAQDQLLAASHDDDVAAIVVRVDSPGGTITAAESLRRAIALAKEQGKPVYISMGTVAASGGYWLATAGDEIWAQSDTLTGSIGIYGIIPTFEASLAELGVYTDGVATSPFAGGFRVDRALSEPVREVIQLHIENGYQRFIQTVADARNMELAAVDAAASGRVWIGSRAQELGLVDNLGGLTDVIAAAAKAANVEDYRVSLYESALSLFDQFVVLMGQNVHLPDGLLRQDLLTKWLQDSPEVGMLEQMANNASQQHYRMNLADVGWVWWPLQLQ